MSSNTTKGKFVNFLYNKEQGSVLGRTPLSWIKILFFYLIFYFALLSLSLMCWCVFLRQISTVGPYRKYPDTLNKPALNHVPTEITREYSEDYDIMQFFQKHEGNTYLDTLLRECPKDTYSGEVDAIGNTIKYCKILKLNKIYGWTPEYYTDINTAPEEIRNIMVRLRDSNGDLERIWVTCKGEVENDPSEKIIFNYIPTQGFPSSFYPFLNQKDYKIPLVAVKYSAPNEKTTKITCTAWAKNLKDVTTSFKHEPKKEIEK